MINNQFKPLVFLLPGQFLVGTCLHIQFPGYCGISTLSNSKGKRSLHLKIIYNKCIWTPVLRSHIVLKLQITLNNINEHKGVLLKWGGGKA